MSKNSILLNMKFFLKDAIKFCNFRIKDNICHIHEVSILRDQFCYGISTTQKNIRKCKVSNLPIT